MIPKIFQKRAENPDTNKNDSLQNLFTIEAFLNSAILV